MSTITALVGTDGITTANSMTKINANFSNLNTDKIETSVLDTDTALTANSDVKIATQKAVKTYVDTLGNVNASETARGIVEEATDAEVTAGTATGGTGAKLFITPAKLATRLSGLTPIRRVYLVGGSPATWSKPAGLKYVDVEVQAGGGGGGSSNTTANGQGGGGGGGGYSKKLILVAALGVTETVTTGAAGTAGSSGAGGNGGNSSFGTLSTATGGTGGSRGVAGAGGAGGAGASGDFNITGQAGVVGSGTSAIYRGEGGNSRLGDGGRTAQNAGSTASGYGSGGSGGYRTDGEYDGGAGTAGIVIVTEYY